MRYREPAMRARLGLLRVAGIGDDHLARRRQPALLHDVRQLVREQPPALRRRRAVLAVAEEDVGAGRERPRLDGTRERAGERVRVDADVAEAVAEGRRQLGAHARVELRAAAARGRDLRRDGWVDAPAGQDAGWQLAVEHQPAAA